MTQKPLFSAIFAASTAATYPLAAGNLPRKPRDKEVKDIEIPGIQHFEKPQLETLISKASSLHKNDFSKVVTSSERVVPKLEVSYDNLVKGAESIAADTLKAFQGNIENLSPKQSFDDDLTNAFEGFLEKAPKVEPKSSRRRRGRPQTRGYFWSGEEPTTEEIERMKGRGLWHTTPYGKQVKKLTGRIRKLLDFNEDTTDEQIQKLIFFSMPKGANQQGFFSLDEVASYSTLEQTKKNMIDYFFEPFFTPSEGEGEANHKNLGLQYAGRSFVERLTASLGEVMPYTSPELVEYSLTGAGTGERAAYPLGLPTSMKPTFPKLDSVEKADEFFAKLAQDKKGGDESVDGQWKTKEGQTLNFGDGFESSSLPSEQIFKDKEYIGMVKGRGGGGEPSTKRKENLEKLLYKGEEMEEYDEWSNKLFLDNLKTVYKFKGYLQFTSGVSGNCDGAALEESFFPAVTEVSLLPLRMGIMGLFADDKYRSAALLYKSSDWLGKSRGKWGFLTLGIGNGIMEINNAKKRAAWHRQHPHGEKAPYYVASNFRDHDLSFAYPEIAGHYLPKTCSYKILLERFAGLLRGDDSGNKRVFSPFYELMRGQPSQAGENITAALEHFWGKNPSSKELKQFIGLKIFTEYIFKMWFSYKGSGGTHMPAEPFLKDVYLYPFPKGADALAEEAIQELEKIGQEFRSNKTDEQAVKAIVAGYEVIKKFSANLYNLRGSF